MGISTWLTSTLAATLALAVATAAEAAAPLPPTDVSLRAGMGTAACDDLSVQPGVAAVDVAANARGDTIVSWTRNAGGGQQMVQASFRPAGGSFEAPQDIGLTDPCYVLGLGGATPDIALDGQGGAVIVFPAIDGGEGAVRASIRPPGGAFGAPVVLATGVPTRDDLPRVAMNSAGTAVALWNKPVGANAVIQSSTRQPGGQFGAATTLSGAGRDARLPRVAVNDAGAAAVAWLRSDGTVDRMQARVKPADQAGFAPARDLSTAGSAGEDADDPDLALDPSGVATATWRRAIDGQTLIQSRFLTASGDLVTEIDNLSDPADESVAPGVAVDASGTAVIVFRACPVAGGPCRIKAAARPAGGSFSPVELISPPVGENVFPRVVMDPGGTAAAAFTPFSENSQMLLTRRPPGGTFGAVQTISPPDGAALIPNIAGDDEGNVLVGWAFASSGSDPIFAAQVSPFDAGAPTLSGVTAPSSANAGRGFGVTATATDRWSPVTLGWSFGDGTAAAGGAATHAFGAAGAFTATVTATDAVGNTSTDARQILVTPPARPARKVIRSKVRATWAVRGKRIFLLRLQVTRAPKGAKAELRCARRKSTKCPFKRESSKKRRKRTITLFKEIKATKAQGRKRRSFRAGQRLELRITKKDFVGKVLRYDLKKGKIPSAKERCLPAGKKKPRKRC